jgi:hypothetical protein
MTLKELLETVLQCLIPHRFPLDLSPKMFALMAYRFLAELRADGGTCLAMHAANGAT